MQRPTTVVVALSAALAELVLVAAAGNQWVVDHLVRNESPRELPRNRELKAVLTGFPWRWTPDSHARMLWLGEITAVAGLVVVGFLLMLAFLAPMRPPRRFVTVFLGTWGIVAALTQIAAIGRAMLAYSDLNRPDVDPQRLGRVWFAVFDGPTSVSVLFGGASGLIVAIVAGIVAAVTSRRAGAADDIDASLPAGHDEVPEWSAALGSAQPLGATQSWPPPDPADRVTGWPEQESTARIDRPVSPEPTARIEPPSTPRESAPTVQWSGVTESTSETVRPRTEPPRPTAAPRPPARPAFEPPSEITLPRAPRPTTELPPPTSRLPLPEERESDES